MTLIEVAGIFFIACAGCILAAGLIFIVSVHSDTPDFETTPKGKLANTVFGICTLLAILFCVVFVVLAAITGVGELLK